MRFAKIRKEDISNGPGTRVSIFVQGCNRNCPDCFNPETHDFTKGFLFTDDIKKQFLLFANKERIAGFSILGGEPLDQNEDMLDLVKSIKEVYPNKTIWLWTGYKFEDLNELQKEILKYIDVLVDGPFISSQKSHNLRFKGSSNQRIINIPESLKQGKIVLYNLC